MTAQYGSNALGRLTRSGLIIVLMIALLLLSAWNTGENLLFIVFGGLAGMLFLSVVAARWSLRRVTLQREAPYAVFRGEPFSFTTHIANHKLLVPSISLRIEQERQQRGYVLRIPARHGATVAVEHCFQKRGVYTLPPCLLSSAFPFGFLEQRRRYTDNVEVLVYPRIRPARLSSLERSSGAQFLPARIAGEGDEFFSLREYVHGDDLRLIVWRISARLGKWMVREMGVGNARIVIFVLDTRRLDRDDFDDHFEEAIELTASLMVTLLHRQYSVGFSAPDVRLECARGTAQERRVLDCLARIMPVDPVEHADFSERTRRLGMEGVRLLYVTPDPERWDGDPSGAGIPTLDPGTVVYA